MIIQSEQYKPTKCLIGLDRDGTINQDDGFYTSTVERFIPIPGSLEAVAKLRSLGHGIVILTNQGGIEKGMYTEKDVDRVHEYMFQLLGQAGCPSIDALYYSAGSRKNDPFKKPNTGMFKRCEREHPHLKFKGGFFVGDKISDLKAAVKVGSVPVLVRTGHGEKTEDELEKFTYRSIAKRTLVFDTLWDFACWIESQS
jgi:D-glycero-D-manno-heptose 1,7-bisphosphate phosphatase